MKLDNLTIFLIIVGIFLVMRYSESFINWSSLGGFDQQWGDFDDAKLQNYKPKKVSELRVNCDTNLSEEEMNEGIRTCIDY